MKIRDLLPPPELSRGDVATNVGHRVQLYYGYYKQPPDATEGKIRAFAYWPPYCAFGKSGGVWSKEKSPYHSETKALANAVRDKILEALSTIQASGKFLSPTSPEVAQVIFEEAKNFATSKIAEGYSNMSKIVATLQKHQKNSRGGGAKRKRGAEVEADEHAVAESQIVD